MIEFVQIHCDIAFDISCDTYMFRNKIFMKRRIGAFSKGFIRCEALESLTGKPMSGSELINEIGKKNERILEVEFW